MFEFSCGWSADITIAIQHWFPYRLHCLAINYNWHHRLYLYNFISIVAVKVQVLEGESRWYSLVRRLNDLQDKTNPRTFESESFISLLKRNGIEILKSFNQLGHDDVWIWCKSQSSLTFLQALYESHKLTHVLAFISDMHSDKFKGIKLHIDMDQFMKETGKFLNAPYNIC